MKTRIEIHLTDIEAKVLDLIANLQSRTTKDLCEREMLKFIQAFSFLKPDDNQESVKRVAFPVYFGSEFLPF